VTLVVVGAAVVEVLDEVEVDDGGTGRSAAATWRVWRWGGTPAGDAPAQVEAPTRAAARSGLATTGLLRIARIGVSTSHRSRRREAPPASPGTAFAQLGGPVRLGLTLS
jgi:hypothetical protein